MTKLTVKQLEIIKTSGEILMEKGISGLTTKNLANEMGFSESALYRHFKNKETIIILMIDYLSSNLNIIFENVLNLDLKENEKYKLLFSRLFSFFKLNPFFIIIVLSEGLIDNSEKIKIEILKLLSKNAESLRILIERGQKSNIFNNDIETEQLIHFIMGAFRWQMLKWKLDNFKFDIEIQGMKTMDSLLTLILKK